VKFNLRSVLFLRPHIAEYQLQCRQDVGATLHDSQVLNNAPTTLTYRHD